MDQYLALCQTILNEGVWIHNDRTNKKVLTYINADLTYNVAAGHFPLVTTRKCFWKSAIAEILGYLRGYDNAADFRKIGTKTWDANANDNPAWLSNPYRKGDDDCGFIYGKVARNFPKPDGGHVDLLKQIVHNLRQGIDNRGEILTFYHPGAFHMGCLRPCMHSHQFSLLGDRLYLNSTQRSCDVPLGLTFNMVQVYVLLALMAQITNTKPAMAYHKIVNAHIYDDQVELMQQQVSRTPYPLPKLEINPDIKSLEDIETWVSLDDFKLVNYQHHAAIKYPFSV
tara:strand:- start:10 stop:858 length:849 start_codon:yes stop_codon:yes gene_type:complete